MSQLAFSNLSKSFGTFKVFENLELSAEAGEIVVIFGGSGTGKTFLLRLIAGVEEPTSGTIEIGGRDVTDVPPERRNVGMAFQNFALFPHMSARENIASPLRAAHADEKTVESGVARVAKLLKIDHVLGHAPRELSNGQKQRTALARALAAEPRDPSARRSIAQCRCQVAIRDASRTAAPVATVRGDGALCDAGLQGGDGAWRPHRGAGGGALRSGRNAGGNLCAAGNPWRCETLWRSLDQHDR